MPPKPRPKLDPKHRQKAAKKFLSCFTTKLFSREFCWQVLFLILGVIFRALKQTLESYFVVGVGPLLGILSIGLVLHYATLNRMAGPQSTLSSFPRLGSAFVVSEAIFDELR